MFSYWSSIWIGPRFGYSPQKLCNGMPSLSCSVAQMGFGSGSAIPHQGSIQTIESGFSPFSPPLDCFSLSLCFSSSPWRDAYLRCFIPYSTPLTGALSGFLLFQNFWPRLSLLGRDHVPSRSRLCPSWGILTCQRPSFSALFMPSNGTEWQLLPPVG